MTGESAAELTQALQSLSAKLDALQGDVRRLSPPPVLPQMGPDDDAASYAWLASLEAPARRRPQVPRLLLEGLFLTACAAAAAIAHLDAVAIGGVMIGAWVLVALIEWAAAHADLRRDTFVPMPAPTTESRDDPAWFVPPVEHTLLETDSVTAITRLPPAPDDADIDATIERKAE